MYIIAKNDALRLRHMLDAAIKARHFVAGRTRQDLETDEMLALALVRLLEILGEAASRVSPEVQQQLPELPWRQMIGARNRLIHGYFNVDLDIVWSTVGENPPRCIAALERVVHPAGWE